ncbi:hypothetical protein GJR96_10545 [Haloferax sp. MBLA0076]|uniref:TIGR04206 family protein n=1 Tax=Haloferax litoreum TaxID=2666140 RepID=A0A6A8GGU5_9EURY|nr:MULTISPECIES: hypothetical protein [Haloferax]KAB1193851.1 hypothetical protein Hfx1148_10505 [Haloferax sp. CBA1148]MRX22395.1 hypothetical protein [Haloferax litoreum]
MFSSLRDRLLPLFPSFVVVAGVLMPWVQVDPNHEGPVIAIYYPGMGSGLELPHGVALLVAVGGLSVLSLAGRRLRRAELVVGVGGAVAVGWFILSWQGAFVPAPGAWVTLVGCLLLAAVGAGRITVARRKTKTVA